MARSCRFDPAVASLSLFLCCPFSSCPLDPSSPHIKVYHSFFSCYQKKLPIWVKIPGHIAKNGRADSQAGLVSADKALGGSPIAVAMKARPISAYWWWYWGIVRPITIMIVILFVRRVFFFIRALLHRPPLQHRHSTNLMRSARRDCLVSIGLARTWKTRWGE